MPDDVVVSWQVHDGDPYQRQAVHIAGIVDPAHFDQGRVWLVFVHGRWEARPVSDAQSADARRHGKSGVPDDPTPGAQPQK